MFKLLLVLVEWSAFGLYVGKKAGRRHLEGLGNAPDKGKGERR
jgi:hypothetical protein